MNMKVITIIITCFMAVTCHEMLFTLKVDIRVHAPLLPPVQYDYLDHVIYRAKLYFLSADITLEVVKSHMRLRLPRTRVQTNDVVEGVFRNVYTANDTAIMIFMTQSVFGDKEDLSRKGTVCSLDAVGISEFKGISEDKDAAFLAHAIGHILGLEHDNDAIHREKNCPGQATSDSYIMMDLDNDTNTLKDHINFGFSPCSKQQFKVINTLPCLSE